LNRYLRALLGLPRYWGRSRDLAYVRLAVRREILPRFTPGSVDLPFGRVDYADAASLEAQYHSIFVLREYEFATASENPVILDCGGNIGLSAMWFKLRYPGARITVFEPAENLFAILSANLVRLGMHDVRRERAALWHENSVLRLHNARADGGFVGEAGQSCPESCPDSGSEVPAVRLADRIAGPVDLLKLDIEGAEYAVLRDLAASGKLSQVRAVAGELHAGSAQGGEVAELMRLFAEAGFSFTLSHARPAPALFCRREETPFPSLADGKYMANFYAWRGDAT